MKVLILIKKFGNLMVLISAYIGVLALAVMSFAISCEVIVRYFFNSPTIWSAEVSRFCNVYVFFMGLAYTLREKAHINVELVINFIPTRPKVFLEIITNIIGIVLAIIITIEGWKMFVDAYTFSIRSMEVLRTPLVIPYFCVLWGGFWLAIQFMFEVSTNIQSLAQGEKIS